MSELNLVKEVFDNHYNTTKKSLESLIIEVPDKIFSCQYSDVRGENQGNRKEIEYQLFPTNPIKKYQWNTLKLPDYTFPRMT